MTTAPGARTRIHHHGECETSIWIASGQARYTFGPTGLEETFDAAAGDFVYIAAGEIHVEENASATEPLVVVITRNCPGSVVHYLLEVRDRPKQRRAVSERWLVGRNADAAPRSARRGIHPEARLGGA